MKNNYKVYKHTNIKNGKVYIGITQQSVEKRWQKGYVGKGSVVKEKKSYKIEEE